MKKIFCEACGSTDLVKEDTIYTCPYCHTVYESNSPAIEKTMKNESVTTDLPTEPIKSSTIQAKAKIAPNKKIKKDNKKLYWKIFLAIFALGSIGAAFDYLKEGNIYSTIEYFSIFVVCTNAFYTAVTSRKVFITKKIAGGWALLLLAVFWALIQNIFGIQGS
ncbi:TFIIB-type zinc finger domain-containing protein [Enterococcus larvae]|uniref:TFIIB-type zinc finger domain-containing protein n=1 Tax=Enterococcus larvae TaxID=2794352 RepID=UPI003F3F6DF7